MAIEYTIDGSRITSLETFYDEISRALVPGYHWGRNLNAFNDILRCGFGTPDEGFTLRWAHSNASREALAYPETVKQLELTLRHCHPDNVESVLQQLAAARAGNGPTVFDWLLDIIEDHGHGGEQAEDSVLLILD